MNDQAFYNEIDKDAAAWLRELIAEGHIAPGIVDERSIEDVRPDELAGFTQCHFFAGIGIWSLALRAAGVPDDFPIWTGSCPCQPFSSAGKGDGFADERHLWPAWYHLISQCRPAGILGEQVASKDAMPWIDLVHTDLEALGYAFGAVPFPSAGIGAPHIRDRLYWVANANGNGSLDGINHKKRRRTSATAECCGAGRMEHPGHHHDAGEVAPTGAGQSQTDRPTDQLGGSGVSLGWMADTTCGQHVASGAWADQRAMAGSDGVLQAAPGPTGPTNGHWRDADWLHCRDGKWRPVEPGTQPLAYGMPRSMGNLSPELRRLASLAGLSKASLKRAKQFRVGSLRGYGNAINAMAAQTFIESILE